MIDCIVIGAGAAGLIAAFTAAERGRKTILLEKNVRPGVKILMSGGTRCNLTQNTTSRGIIEAYGDQGRFLHSALAILSPQDLVQMIEAEGVPTKIEDTNKIFPASDRAQDILDALMRRVERSGAELALAEPVESIRKAGEAIEVVTSKRTLAAPSVVLTTGGLSYPGSGTTGDGYRWAEFLGHRIVTPRPALTPLTTNDDWVRELTGLTMPDVHLRVVLSANADAPPVPTEAMRKAKGMKRGILAEQRGSLLFTHFGLSGPAVLDVSRAVTSYSSPQSLLLLVDFLPERSTEQLDAELRTEFAADGKRQLAGALARVIPRRLAEALLDVLKIDREKRLAEVSKQDRTQILGALKQTSIKLSGAMGYRKAEVTAGGVSLAEVDSKTMQSKIVPGLYFAGEVLDLDGPIGGYNFQAAFATGKLAGMNV